MKHRYRCRATDGMGLPSGQKLTTQPAHARSPSPHPLDLVGLENSIADVRHPARLAMRRRSPTRSLHLSTGGKELRQRQKVYRMARPLGDENGLMRYRASKLDCDACPSSPAAARTHRPARSCARSVGINIALVKPYQGPARLQLGRHRLRSSHRAAGRR